MNAKIRLVTALLILAAARPLPGAANSVKWRSISEGEAEAKRSGKPVLYFMTADWCGPCQVMKREVFADAKIAALIEKSYVPVEVVDRRREEGRNSEEADRLFARYRCRGFPTLTISRPGSREAFQAAGWSGKEATAEYLRIGRQRFEEQERSHGAKEVTP